MREWISVNEKLPEDVYGKKRKQITVLVCTKSGNVIACSRVRSWKYSKEEQRYLETEGEFEWNKTKHVTHWMPLPKKPKEE